jgi:hypothetical protein
METTGTVRKVNVRVCNVNARINFPSWRTISAEMCTVQVGIHGNCQHYPLIMHDLLSYVLRSYDHSLYVMISTDYIYR